MKYLAAILGLVAVVAVYMAYKAPKPKDCAAQQLEAAITRQAAEICTTRLVGCALSYQEVRAVVSEVEAARACQ